MTVRRKIMVCPAILVLAFTSACAANGNLEADVVNAPNSKTTAASQDYVKPGAAVSYSHNLASKLEANETITFQLTLQESYKQGTLNVSVAGEGAVQIFAVSSGATYDMATGSNHVMDISFTATAEGRHYINVQAMADDGGGQVMPRTFSIPVQIGNPVAMKPNEKMQTTSSGDNVIVMDAEETIK